MLCQGAVVRACPVSAGAWLSLGRYLWERAFQASQNPSGDNDRLLGSPVPGRRPLKPELTAALLAYCRVAEVVGSNPVCLILSDAR